MAITAAERRARQNLRDRRWRSMSLPALMALKARLDAKGIPVPGVMWQRLAVESNKMQRDPVYRAKVLRDAPLQGREPPKARTITYTRRTS